MNQLTRIILLAVAGVIVFDTLGSIAALTVGFPFAFLLISSFLIYLAAGFFATRYSTLKMGVLAGAVVGLVDGTVGWTISWLIGPGKPAGQTIDIAGLLFAVVTGTLIAAFCGLLGGILEQVLLRARRNMAGG